MSLYPVLVFVLLRLFPAFCDDCPKGLHEAFEKNFDLAKGCGEICTLMNSPIVFGHQSWTGFCFRDVFTFFPDWSCHVGVDGLEKVDYFVLMSGKDCEIKIGKGNYSLDKRCLEKYNYGKCWKFFDSIPQSENLLQQQNGVRWKRKTSFPDSRFFKTLSSRSLASTHNLFTRRKLLRKRTTTSSSTGSPVYTSTPTSWPETSTPISSSSVPNFNESDLCEVGEAFFQGHCYFLKGPYSASDGTQSIELGKKNSSGKNESKTINFAIQICESQHPKALAVAVETREEKEFVLEYLSQLLTYHGRGVFVLSSGMKLPHLPSEWIGWKSLINESLLGLDTADRNDKPLLIFFNLMGVFWTATFPEMSHYHRFYLLCERVYNPKNIRSDLHAKCLNLYRNSVCYNQFDHCDYCCAIDEYNELWFGCPGQIVLKRYPDGSDCIWECNYDGTFFWQYPVCWSFTQCRNKFNNIHYEAPYTKHAVSACPYGLFGTSTWYCNANGTFSDVPDYSLCCEETELCSEVDAYLRTWLACPLSKAVKRVECPPGSVLKEAVVEWDCLETGIFDGSSPDYSKCYESGLTCQGRDNYDREWTGVPGKTSEKICPPSFKGLCFWKCGQSGQFENDQPDCSKCRADWMEEIADKIKNGTNHEVVMEAMVNYTELKDLTMGFSHVLNLTSECVDLFKKQYSNSEIQVFDRFLTHYSKILKNVAGNSSTWSTFGVENRKEYSYQILQTTQNATFAKLSLDEDTNSSELYNATFATFESDGFDFFVSYNPWMKGSKFPLANFSRSDWQLEVKDVNRSDSNFAAVGLVMNYSLSSLMFPLGMKTEKLEINAPAVTFAVAVPRNGEAIVVSDVVVSLSFKHTNRTRFPDSQLIRRKLHEGEKPSGIFNSTLCYYYSDGNWSKEGCAVTFTSKELTNCTCTHLSTISLLMSVHKYQPNPTLETVSLFSSGISVISLTLALIVFYTFDSITNERVLIGKNLCFCLLVGHVLLITVMDKRFFYISDVLCMVFAVLLHYVFMSAFFWMFIEGCHLYRMLVLVFDSNKEYQLTYLLVGYGMPFLVVGVTELIGFVFREQPYGEDELCWLKTPNYVWAFTGPVVIITSINFLILLKAITLAIASSKRTEKSNFVSLMIWIKGWFSLSTLLGVTWLLGLTYINYDELFVYLFVVLNGVQGFFIFLFRCVCNEQYRAAFVKKFKIFISNSNQLEKYKKFDKSGSGTKLFVITQSSSKSNSSELHVSGYDSTTLHRGDKEINIQKNILGNLSKDSIDMTHDELKSSGVDLDFKKKSVTLDISQNLLRNRFLSSSPCTVNGEVDKDNFPELSYHANKY